MKNTPKLSAAISCLLLATSVACSSDPEESNASQDQQDQGVAKADMRRVITQDMAPPRDLSIAKDAAIQEDMARGQDMLMPKLDMFVRPDLVEEDMATELDAGPGCDTGLCADMSPAVFTDEQWSMGEWKVQVKGPSIQGNQDDMWCFDADRCMVGNSFGQIWETRDGGMTWASLLNQPGTFFRAIAFFDDNVGIAANIGTGLAPSVTDTNVFYRTEDGGVSWSPVTVTQQGVPGMCNLHPVDAQTMWASGRVNGPGWVSRTLDAGKSWEWFDLSEQFDMVIDIEMKSATEGLVIGSKNGQGKVLQTKDAGQTWKVVWQGLRRGELPWKISFPTPLIGYIGVQNQNQGGSTRVLKTMDGGDTWTARNALRMPYRVKGIGFVTPNVGWLAGENQAYKTNDGGQTWVEVEGLGGGVNRFRFPEPGVAWAVGSSVWKLDLRP